MRDQERLTRPVVVSLPAEIDNANAEHVGEELRAAFVPTTVEMGLTVFCCTYGSHQLVAAHKGRRTGSQTPKAHGRASRRPVVAAGR